MPLTWIEILKIGSLADIFVNLKKIDTSLILAVCNEYNLFFKNEMIFLKSNFAINIITIIHGWWLTLTQVYKVCPKSIRPAFRLFFFDCEGVLHYEFAPRGQTINKEYYVEVLKRLRDAVRRKRPRFWSSGDWIHRTLCSNFWRNTRLYSFASLRTVPT